MKFGRTLLSLDEPIVMGVLNVTPDSFSDGGQYRNHDAALRQAERMLADGAAIIDVGGESTRPGAAEVSEQEESDRVLPIVAAIAGRFETVVSVDTSKPGIMLAALREGAGLINDVYALQIDGAIASLADEDCAICLMHMQGVPRSMQDSPTYEDVAAEVTTFLKERVEACVDGGISIDRLLVDPGFGFGKKDTHNLELLANLDLLQALGLPILVGLSRKKTLGNLTGRDVDQRLAAGLAAAVLAVAHGASIVRTHDVAETVDALKVATGVIAAARSGT